MNSVEKNKLISQLILVPGIYGLANMELSNDSALLSKDDYNEAIIVDESTSGDIISIAIYIRAGISTAIVAEEIKSAMKNAYKKIITDRKLDSVKIYVRGVK